MTEKINRRQSVRVDDRVLLSAVRISSERLRALSDEASQGISLYSQEGLADIRMFVGAQNALARVREKDPDLAEFLQHLDNKINLLIRREQGGKSPYDALVMQKINLSGDGIAFHCDREAHAGEVLELHLVLLPAYVHIYSIGKVISCAPATAEEAERGKVRVAVEFALIMEEDREKIIQHTFRLQSLALRNRRLRAEEAGDVL
ncbi:MAG: PilZ domain-containing protein [Thermodesulfobacteriota bacterium]